MGSMFIAARCASHFQFNTNSSHHYTNSLVAIAFYIEYCPSFLISVKKRARLIEHCRLKFFSVLNDQIAVPPGRNVPRLPLAISSGWLSNWVGLPLSTTRFPSTRTSTHLIPGVNAACHGLSTLSYDHVTESLLISGKNFSAFRNHCHTVSGVCVTSDSRRRT